MTQSAAKSVRIPVNTAGLKERMLVRAALMNCDAQLQNFTPLRDRLVSSGQDPNAKYRDIQSERDRLAVELKKLTPAASPVLSPALPGSSASSLPIEALRFIGTGLGPWFGYSGSVRMARAQEGEVQNPAGGTGSIDVAPDGLLLNAGVLFTGDLITSANAGIWLHNWHYLVVFPVATVRSAFTYSFGMGVQASVWGGQGSATFLSFIALGEAANFTGQQIAVNNDGYPLATNVTSPTSAGALNLQRSFAVGAGEVPAVAVVVGVAAALSPHSEVMFSQNPGDSFICLAASIDPATAVGPYTERGIVNFHYQPLGTQLSVP